MKKTTTIIIKSEGGEEYIFKVEEFVLIANETDGGRRSVREGKTELLIGMMRVEEARYRVELMKQMDEQLWKEAVRKRGEKGEKE